MNASNHRRSSIQHAMKSLTVGVKDGGIAQRRSGSTARNSMPSQSSTTASSNRNTGTRSTISFIQEGVMRTNNRVDLIRPLHQQQQKIWIYLPK